MNVLNMDKVRFRNEKAKPFAEKAILKMLDKAFPCDDNDDEDDEDEKETKKRRTTKSAAATKKKSKPDPEPEDDDDWDEDDVDDEDVVDYSDMTAKELYDLCKERDIKVPVKKPEKFYIKQLEEYDQAQEDWGEDEDDDEDDWEDD